MTDAAIAIPMSLVLVEEFTHRVLNDYMRVIAGLRLAARAAADEEVRCQLIEAADELHVQASAHRALAMPAPGARCEIGTYLADLCATLANTLRARIELNLELGGFDPVVAGDRGWRLALIVSELLQNAARHGETGGRIVVKLSLLGSQLVCEVSNGCTRRSTSSSGFGRGRRIVTALAAELGGLAEWRFTPTLARAFLVVPTHAATIAEFQ
ncbi:MAG: sensor histidine kinase [Bradyrhizobium sp.]|nr:sensor histidine kinase [Bradyrhizobium sp.]